MSYNNIFTIKGTLSNLKLSAVEHCFLSDMKKAINELKNNNYFKIEDSVDSNSLLPLFENYNEKDFDEFFMSLGSKRAKELINLFRKIKTRIGYDLFESEVLIFYFCIRSPELFNIFYINVERYSFDDGGEHGFDDGEGLSIDQKFQKIKKSLELELRLNFKDPCKNTRPLE
ncbi:MULTISPECIES: P52 family lipoprotein [Borreliella]|uniref:Uncharacterized protein n=1 Tax=Borrelia garinii subsp. bavariensis (strain ATCC BAA-2496 / DSM 23469 / PBi) TaxID=290434 RepID=A0ABM7AS55_BORGP|nr:MULTISPECIES: P52 family lipoprotein [Borreliella]AZA27453.1 hypothetical protein DB299_06400 [Borreliella bavariensis PBi]WLN24684.1 P52 family lipoprotein [Borreliella bavariensis]